MDMRSERTFPAAVLSTVRYPLILVDREGGIEAVSHAAADLLTVSPEASRGSSIDEVAGSHGRLLHDAVASVVASGTSFTTELRSQGQWFDVVVDPNVGETGNVSGAVIHANRRITQPSEEAGLAAGSDPLWLILDQLPHAVYWKDRQSRYLGGNRVFAEVVGLGSPRAVLYVSLGTSPNRNGPRKGLSRPSWRPSGPTGTRQAFWPLPAMTFASLSRPSPCSPSCWTTAWPNPPPGTSSA